VTIGDEPLTDTNLPEVVQFFRDSNPFAQLTWGWDTGRFIDWRWSTNAVFDAAAPGWFSEHCRVFRRGPDIRAVSVAEYGTEDTCIITESQDPASVQQALGWLLEHRGRPVRFECSEEAAWLGSIFSGAGFVQTLGTAYEWEYDLHRAWDPPPPPTGFVVRTAAAHDYPGINQCIKRAFGSDFDFEPGLHSLASNPFFLPGLSLVAVAPDGRIAAYCHGTVDPDNGVAGIDPICTDPDFQRMGLGRAVVIACFRGQARLGGQFSYIGSATEPAPGVGLYQMLGPSRRITFGSWSSP
jgi:GNAT superfamily N-acetyltransferase